MIGTGKIEDARAIIGVMMSTAHSSRSASILRPTNLIAKVDGLECCH
jgi:hypothetical protein